MLFLIAFAQLNYVVDIVARLCRGRARHVTALLLQREITTKCLESAPQLYFQAYVLFALGTHGEPLQAVSVAISVASLTYGGMKAFFVCRHLFVAENVYMRLASILSKIMILLAGSLDQAWRAGAFALVLTQASRPIGIALLVSFWVLFVSTATVHLRMQCPRPNLLLLMCFCATLGTLVAHLTPGMLLVMGNTTHNRQADEFTAISRCLPRLAVLRWTEGLVCVGVAFAVSKTPCGYTPWREAWGLLGCLLASAFLYLTLQLGSSSMEVFRVFKKAGCFKA